MEKVNLLNLNNEILSVSVVRYFMLDNNSYLIYSLNEVDNQNYVKLYAAHIVEQNGTLIGLNVSDENSWTAIKEFIKQVVRDNQSGTANVDDLDYNNLENVKINDQRVFKLSSQLVNLLAANKKQVVEPTPAPIDSLNETIISNEQVDSPQMIQPNVTLNNVESNITPEQAVMGIQPEIQQAEAAPQNIDQSNNAEVDYYKSLYQQEKNKNEELSNKLNEIKKILG